MKRILVGAVVVAALAVGGVLSGIAPVGAQTTTTTTSTAPTTTTTTVPPTIFRVPSTIDSTCATNVTGKLNDFFAGLPSGSTVSMGNAQSCYRINKTLAIRDKSLHIEGNGATLNQPTAGGPTQPGQGPAPIFLLAKTIDTTVSDLNINGAFDGSTNTGGSAYERFIGVEVVSTKNTVFTNVNVTNIQGDGFSVQFPVTSNPINVSGTMLNRNFLWQGGSIKKCGWVAISITSVDGFRMTGAVVGKAVDSIDMEYNLYSSQITESGQARYAAMNNILFDHDTFNNWQFVWFVTKNNQTKCQPHGATKPCPEGGGVQQRNVTLEDNKLSGTGGLVDVLGQNPAWTTEPYTNQNLTIVNNVNSKEARPLFGGAITTQHAGFAMQLQYVTNVVISGNVFPLYHGHPGYHENTTYIDALKPKTVAGLNLTFNDFFGALAVTYGGGDNQNVTKCKNTKGLVGEVDTACPVNVMQLPTTTTTTVP